MKKSILAITAICIASVPQLAFAAAAGGALPWEGPLAVIQASITGPVAISIALIAIAVAGGMLIFGGEINNFARTGVYITLVLGLLVMANNVLAALYGGAAVIPDHLNSETNISQSVEG